MIRGWNYANVSGWPASIADNHDLPDLQGAVAPFLPEAMVRNYVGSFASFDAGRGCPFKCSFCTIINVQGRRSRYRTADDVEKLIRTGSTQGINRYFISDDNFARNKNGESIFDRLIELRHEFDGDLGFMIQVDSLAHKIPNFTEKAALAGVSKVFIGLENINPESRSHLLAGRLSCLEAVANAQADLARSRNEKLHRRVACHRRHACQRAIAMVRPYCRWTNPG